MIQCPADLIPYYCLFLQFTLFQLHRLPHKLFKHTKQQHTPTSGPLHLLFHILGIFPLPDLTICMSYSISFRSLLTCHLYQSSSLINPHYSLPISFLLCCSVFFYSTCHYLSCIYWFIFFFCILKLEYNLHEGWDFVYLLRIVPGTQKVLIKYLLNE